MVAPTSPLLALREELLDKVVKHLWEDPLALLCFRVSCRRMRTSCCPAFRPPTGVVRTLISEIAFHTVTSRQFEAELQLCLFPMCSYTRKRKTAVWRAVQAFEEETRHCLRGLAALEEQQYTLNVRGQKLNPDTRAGSCSTGFVRWNLHLDSQEWLQFQGYRVHCIYHYGPDIHSVAQIEHVTKGPHDKKLFDFLLQTLVTIGQTRWELSRSAHHCSTKSGNKTGPGHAQQDRAMGRVVQQTSQWTRSQQQKQGTTQGCLR